MTQPSKVIGIIGGMGPAAGVDFHQKLIEENPGLGDQQQLSVVHLSFSSLIPDRTAYLSTGKGTNPGQPIAEMVTKAYNAGARVMAVPCNTAHVPPIWELVQKRAAEFPDLILLHLIETTASFLGDRPQPPARVGILATTGTCRMGTYQRALGALGMEVVVPGESIQQNLVQRAIDDTRFGIKAHSRPVTAEARNLLQQALRNLADQGAQTVVLGCTELPLAITETRLLDLEIVDSTRVLAKAVVKAAKGLG